MCKCDSYVVDKTPWSGTVTISKKATRGLMNWKGLKGLNISYLSVRACDSSGVLSSSIVGFAVEIEDLNKDFC